MIESPRSPMRAFAAQRTFPDNRHPGDRDAAAAAIRGLIERIVLTPGEKWVEMDASLHGDLGAILEWAGNGHENTGTDILMSEMSVSVVAGAGIEPSAFRL